MVKKFAPIYTTVTVKGNQQYQCCQCGRLHQSVLKVGVHVYYHHPHLRAQAAKGEVDIKESFKYLYGLLTPKKIEAFKKVPIKRSLRVSVSNSASHEKSNSSSRKSLRIEKFHQMTMQRQIQQNLESWVKTGNLNTQGAKSTAKTPITANTRSTLLSY